jgi:hypothetical protein
LQQLHPDCSCLQICLKQISDALASLKYPAMVAVPNNGLFIFGSETNSLTTAQKLTSLTGTWTAGPAVYLNQPNGGQCVVQVLVL